MNAVALAKLANATATIAGQAVEGIFDAEYQEMLGVSVATPNFLASSASLAGIASKSALTITCASLGMTDVPYTVAEIQAEHGATRLMLRKA